MSSIRLHIDRVVVHGMSRADGKRFAIALEKKLRQWAESGLAGVVPGDARLAIKSVEAGQLRPGATPTQAATQVVEGIQTRLGASSAPPSKASDRSR